MPSWGRRMIRAGALRIRVNVSGAEVSVNGRAFDPKEPSEDVFADPGQATVLAKLAGYDDPRQVVEVAKGGAPREVPLFRGGAFGQGAVAVS